GTSRAHRNQKKINAPKTFSPSSPSASARIATSLRPHPPSNLSPRSCCAALRRLPCAEIRPAPGHGSRERGLLLRRRTASAVRLLQPAPSHEIRRRTESASSGLCRDTGAGMREPLHTTPPRPIRRRGIQARRLLRPALQSCDPWMAGGKGARGTSRFIRHLRMKRALGIQPGASMWPNRKMRGRDRRRGTWWDLKRNCIAIEGQDFAQDTEEGGADEFVLIPDSDEERGAKDSSLLGDDDEYVPETEPQDVVTESGIIGIGANQGRKRLGALLHDWLRIISDVDNESGKVEMESGKLDKESAKVEMESGKLEMCAKVQMGGVKLEMESDKLDTVKLEMESDKLGSVKMEMESEKLDCVKLEEELDHMVSFSDMETDDEGCFFQDGVDLRGHSQVEDEDFN
ncbi:unnamed protein product, partial [Urochloa humidicola]